MKRMKNKKIKSYILFPVLSAVIIGLTGCFFTPDIRTVTTYGISLTPPPQDVLNLPITVGIERVEGRTIYQQKGIVVRPNATLVETYNTARWVDTPCDMIEETLFSFLAPVCREVTTMPPRHNEPLDVLLSVYIDTMDSVQTAMGWYAIAKVKYELVSAESRALLDSGWVTRERVMTDSKVDSYVSAQTENISDICKEITNALADVSIK